MNAITKIDGIGPALDELVPSRYALRVGEIDVLVISDGVVTPPAESMATNADPAVRRAWLDDMFLSRDAFDWALNAVVVRSGGRTILIDSGLGVEVPDFRRAGHLVQRLEAAGIDLASVTDVVLTHMHFDHVGGLLVDGVKDRLRPDLRIHVATAEVKFWASPDFSRTAMGPMLSDVARRASKRFLEKYHSQLRPFEAEYEVAPGVVVQRTGGHTPGPPRVRRRPADVRRRRRVPGLVRPPRVAQRLRTRPRGGDPRSDPSSAGAGGEPRGAGVHAHAVPVRRPSGGRRRPLSLGTGLVGLLTACRGAVPAAPQPRRAGPRDRTFPTTFIPAELNLSP
jgi:hypothetical protein